MKGLRPLAAPETDKTYRERIVPIARRTTTPRTTAVDLFSGCGGLTLGLERAGFDVLAAIEIDPWSSETYRLNHPGVRLIQKDIREVGAPSLRRKLGLKKGELDLLAGCPPCQGFSRMRTKNSDRAARDPRNELISEFARFVCEFMPKTVMLENVPALARHGRFGALQRVLKSLGYSQFVDVLDAADYGVPQRRKRLILLASRVHEPVPASPRSRRVTVRQAIGSLDTKDELHCLPERRSQAVQALIKMLPKNGGSRKDLPEKFVLACHAEDVGFFDVYGRMSWDDVAPTITSGCSNPSKGRFVHPVRDRAISLREAALLQGFPKKYRFDVSAGKERLALMIGNALPPPFIAAHARKLRQAVLDISND